MDRKAKEPEAVGVSARKPGTRWVAEQEPRAAVPEPEPVVAPKVADAAQGAAADEEDKTEILISNRGFAAEGFDKIIQCGSGFKNHFVHNYFVEHVPVEKPKDGLLRN